MPREAFKLKRCHSTWPGSHRTFQLQRRCWRAQTSRQGELSKELGADARGEVVSVTHLSDWEASIWELLWNGLGILRPNCCVLPLWAQELWTRWSLWEHSCVFLIPSHPSAQPWTFHLRSHTCLITAQLSWDLVQMWKLDFSRPSWAPH